MQIKLWLIQDNQARQLRHRLKQERHEGRHPQRAVRGLVGTNAPLEQHGSAARYQFEISKKGRDLADGANDAGVVLWLVFAEAEEYRRKVGRVFSQMLVISSIPALPPEGSPMEPPRFSCVGSGEQLVGVNRERAHHTDGAGGRGSSTTAMPGGGCCRRRPRQPRFRRPPGSSSPHARASRRPAPDSARSAQARGRPRCGGSRWR